MPRRDGRDGGFATEPRVAELDAEDPLYPVLVTAAGLRSAAVIR